MTGSVAGESHNAQSDEPKTTGKSTEDRGEKTAEQQDSGSVSSSPKEDKGFLPPLETLTLKTSDPPPVSPQRASSESPRKFSRCASSLPAVAAKRTDEGAGSLARHGRAQSVLTLCSGASSSKPSATPRNVGEGNGAGRVLDDSGFHGYYGARSELGSGTASLRRRPHHHHHHHHPHHHEGRAYGTLERATSYGSLTTPRPHHHFRSANSTRPRPAPPCTTTHLDYGRPAAYPTTATATAGHMTMPARGGGTPRRNNPHPVGLHFQSPYNRDGKTFEVWSPDESSITNRLPQMCKHIDQTNFTCGKTQLYPSRGVPSDIPLPSSSSSSSSATGGSSHGASVYHSSYRSPQGRLDHDLTLPTTRFGSSHNRAAAIGVVPNVMSPHCAERRVRLHVPRGQKLESLV